MSEKAKEYIKTIKNFSVNKKVNAAADLLEAEIEAMDTRIIKLEMLDYERIKQKLACQECEYAKIARRLGK